MTAPMPPAGPRRRRRWVRPVLALAFVVVPLVEIWAILQVGQLVGPWWTILGLFAVVVAMCSEADAFVAASLTAFSDTAKLAFMVVGPMVDGTGANVVGLQSVLLRWGAVIGRVGLLGYCTSMVDEQ